MHLCYADLAVTFETKGTNLPEFPVQSFADPGGSIVGPSPVFEVERDPLREVAATRGRLTTIVIRKGGSQFKATGPSRFLGGYPIFANGKRNGTLGERQWSGQRLQARVDSVGMFPLFYGEISHGSRFRRATANNG
jgi:hypothetical protein